MKCLAVLFQKCSNVIRIPDGLAAREVKAIAASYLYR